MGSVTVSIAGTGYVQWYKWRVIVKVRSTYGLPGITRTERIPLNSDGGCFQRRIRPCP